MWKVYVILALSTQSLCAQENIQVTNSRGGAWKTPIKTSDVYPDYDFNTRLTNANKNNANKYFSLLPDRVYNKNSRDSFGDTDALLSHKKEADINKPEQNEYTTTKSFEIDINLITTQPPTTWKTPTSGSFNAKLFDIMSSRAQYENLVYSPISLQTLLAFIFSMSDGKLYEELAHLLAISDNRTHVAKVFENILQNTMVNTQSTTLIMANKLYYDYRFGPTDHSVRSFAKKSFDSEMEQIDFFASKKAASIINSWVSDKTRNLIQDIVSPSTISGETNALLLNSIYFKSEWLTKFDTSDTETKDFFITKQTKVPVNMMYNEDVFRYGDFSQDLQASVVELPYKTSNLSMLLILPEDIEGLAKLETKLKYYDFDLISKKLKRDIVTVKLPRFKIEYEIDMIGPLQQMGLNALFNNAGSINLFKNQQKPLKVDQFKHKSFINVNEAGTEAAATSVAKYISLSIPSDMKYFTADHPFVYIIRDENTTFFMGHVVKF